MTGWWPDLALLAGVAVLTGALATDVFGEALLSLDVTVRDWFLAHRYQPLYLLARSLNHLGSARLMAAVCLAVAVPLAVRRRSWIPLLPIVSAYAISNILIGPIKLLADRAAPLAPAADAVRLFADPHGMSYPSGHVVNTFIYFPVLALLLSACRPQALSGRASRLIRVIPPVIVSTTVSYLTFHWLTDVVAGVLLGVLLSRLLRRLPLRLDRPNRQQWIHPDETANLRVTDR